MASRTRRAAVIGLTAVSVLALSAVLIWALLLPPPPLQVLRTVQLTHFGRVDGVWRPVTDGAQVYFTERTGGHWGIARVSVAGGEPVPIPTPFRSVGLYDISPNHSELLVGSSMGGEDETPLWVLPVLGGSPRRLGDVTARGGAAWSPDGQWIVYALGSDLYLVRPDGSESRKLVTTAGKPWYPRWSPDGRVLRFNLEDPTTHYISLWEVSREGRGLHRLLAGWRESPTLWGDGESCGDWTRDGRYFVFRSARAHMSSVWAVRERGGFLRRPSRAPTLLTTSDLYFWNISLGDNGGRGFFGGGKESRELASYDARLKEFVPYLSGIPARRISFSRDGQWVAYTTEPGLILWRSRLDGSARLQLTFPPPSSWDPRWSPNGQRIAFSAGAVGKQRIFLISPEGGKRQMVTSGDSDDERPEWAPDGSSLLFQRASPSVSGTVATEHLELLDLDTKQVSAFPGSEGLGSPSWSPAGRYVVALASDGQRLMLFDSQSHRWSRLANGTGVVGLSWSHDGRYVYFQDFWQDTEQPIYRVRISDRKIERIATSKQILRSDAMAYGFVGLAPDGSPLASLMLSTGDIYALDFDLP